MITISRQSTGHIQIFTYNRCLKLKMQIDFYIFDIILQPGTKIYLDTRSIMDANI